MANIGFVGLGHMGLPMAINLIKAGHRVTGFDLQGSALDAFGAAGGIKAPNLSIAANSQDILITMLQTGEQVARVCCGDNGLFKACQPQTLFIDCSSIDVETSRMIHQKGQQHHLITLDAPVSGGVKGAESGNLTFMVGGSIDDFVTAKHILSCMGKTIIHAGDAGSGQAAKICNNMILGISMIAVSEAFTLAEQLGLSPQKLHEVVTHASGQCWVMNQYVPVPGVLENVPANHDYQAGFTSAMMLKDLALSQRAAHNCGITTSLGKYAFELYQQLNEKGMGDLDFSVIIKL